MDLKETLGKELPNDRDTLFKRIHLASLELAQIRTLDTLYRRAVDLGKEYLDIDRMAIFLYDPKTQTRQGTWGTDENGATCDESAYCTPIGDGESYLLKTIKAHDDITVWENKELTTWNESSGFGWNSMAMLWDGDTAFGWIAADNLLRKKPMEPGQKEGMSLYARIVANLILRMRYEQSLKTEVQAKTLELSREKERLQNLYEEIVEQDEMKKKLFTIFAHDIRGPLGGIRTLLDMTCSDLDSLSLPDIKMILPEIRKSVGATYSLADNLLDWVRNQMVKSEISHTEFSMLDALKSTIELCEPSIKKKNIKILLSGPDDIQASSDEYMVEIILRNLLSNAVKFTPAGGSIQLSISRAADVNAILVCVKDNGIGMDEESVAGLFTLQTKMKSVGTEGEKGSGLGLMFCQDIAKRLGARIEAQSALGMGSEFTLVLPAPNLH